MTKIYQRYLFSELAKSFFFILGIFFTLFMIVHFSIGVRSLHQTDTPTSLILLYQIAYFSDFLDLVCPFTLLLSAVKVYISLASRKELVALLCGGLSKKALVHPLLLFGALVVGFLYLSYQVAIPYAHRWQEAFYTAHVKQAPLQPVSHFVVPQDGSELIYAEYHPKDQTLHDVFWLKTPTEIWHFKELHLGTRTAAYADRFNRSKNQWQLTESEEKKRDIPITFSKQSMDKQLLPLRSQSLSMLAKGAQFSWGKMSNRSAQITTRLLRLWTLPLTAFFAILLPAQLCMSAARSTPIYLFFFWSILGGICYLVIVNVSCILGSSQLIAPLVAVCAAPFGMTLLTCWSYARL